LNVLPLLASKGRLPVILQGERSECGLACLAMLLGYHGHQTDLHTLRQRHAVSLRGATLKGLIGQAEQLALAPRALRVELDELSRLSLPAILHWHFDHFVVLQKVTRQGLVIHDPATGKRVISRQEADRAFTGVALECVPAPAFSVQDSRQRLRLREIWANAGGLSGSLLQLLLLSLLVQGFALAMPFYTQLVIDDVIVNSNKDLLQLLAAGFFLLVVFRQLTEWLRSWVVLYASNRISLEFAVRLCRHLLGLPHAYFARRHLGDVVSRFSSLDKVREFLCSGIVTIVIDGVMVLVTLVFMLFYSPWLTLIALMAVCFYLLLRLASFPAMRQCQEKLIADKALENTVFMENIRAIQPIKLFGRESERLANWQNHYARVIASGMRFQKLGMGIQVAHGFLAGSETVFLLLAGALAVLGGELSLGMLMAFLGFKEHFFRSVFSLVDKVMEFRLLDVDLERLADIAFCEPEFSDRESRLLIAQDSTSDLVSLENVGFSHDQDGPALFSHISLKLVEGTRNVIIGPTGCGKSTLLKMVAGLVRPDQGRVVCRGRLLNPGTMAAWRNQLGTVMQNDTLLSGSLLENITFFDPAPDLDRVMVVIRQAMISEDIAAMPMQLQTMVGNMGAALSGGQVQRLLLARALYRKPALLLLDEATSHLDIATEQRINTMLRDLAVTCLAVAHRPETVLQADAIWWLQPHGLVRYSHDQFQTLMSPHSRMMS